MSASAARFSASGIILKRKINGRLNRVDSSFRRPDRYHKGVTYIMNIYFLGGGNMATAIAGGLVKQDGYRVHIVERGAERRAQLVQELGVAASETCPN